MLRMDNLFATFLIGFASATAFLLLSKNYKKLGQLFKIFVKGWEVIKKQIGIVAKKQYFVQNDLEKSFQHNMHFLYSFLGSEDFKYKLPMILFIGSEQSGKTALIDSLALERTIDDLKENHELCQWSFFNEAIMLEVSGTLFSEHKSYIESDHKNWTKLLDLFAYHRPERPVDSVVLVVSMLDLLDENININGLAEHYYIKIWQMQRRFGVNFPIYVVFTHTDVLPGFEHFSNIVDLHLDNDVLGWSNPNLTTPIDSIEYIQNVITSVINRIWYVQQEMMVKYEMSESSIMLFPVELTKIRDRLSDFLFYVFKRNSLHDNFMIRGFYFTGSKSGVNSYAKHQFSEALQSVEFGEISNLPSVVAKNRIVFSQDLFVNKIFKEKGLTIPLSSNIFNNSRKVRLIQYLVLLASVGGVYSLGYHYLKLKKVSHQLSYDIANIRLAVHNAKLMHNGIYDELDNSIFEEQARILIQSTKQINPSVDLFSYYFPPSWFSASRHKLNFMMGRAYEFIVFDFIVKKFNHDIQQLIDSDIVGVHYHDKNVFNPLKLKEFKHLSSYVSEVVKLENTHHKLQRIGYLHNIHDFIYVLKALFGLDFSNELLVNRSTFQNVMEFVRIKTKSFDTHQESIRNKFNVLVDNFVRDSLHYYKVIPYMHEIENTLLKIEQREDHNIEMLNDYLSKLISAFNRQEFKWIYKSGVNLGTEYNTMLYKVHDSYILGNDIAVNMKMKIESKINELKMQLLNHKLPMVGILFKLNDRSNFEISNEFAEFQGMLNLLYGKKFMLNQSYTPIVHRSRVFIKWDVSKLRSVDSIIKEFDDFNNHRLSYKDIKTRHIIDSIACNSVMRNVKRIINESQLDFEHFMDDHNMLMEVSDNFSQSAASLLKILKFIEPKNKQLFSTLKNMILKQAIGFLDKLSKVLDAKQLYSINDTQFYLENRANKIELNNYLLKQREQMIAISDLAVPFIMMIQKLLNGQEIYDVHFAKWTEITKNVAKYRSGTANSLQALEKLIVQHLSNKKENKCMYETVQNCSDSHSYFNNMENDVRASLVKKCVNDNYDNAKKSYLKLYNYFNKHLAHKFPFANNAQVQITHMEAKALINLWDSVGINVSFIDYLVKNNDKSAWVLFLHKMSKSLPWLKVFVNAKKNASMIVNMRTNRYQEKLANHLAICRLQVGDQSIFMNEGAKEVKINDDDFRFLFKISKDSGYSFEEGKFKEIRADGFFGLIKLLSKFGVRDEQGQQLKIVLPVGNEKLIVWVDIEFKGDINEFPDFPTYAPSISRKGVKKCIK